MDARLDAVPAVSIAPDVLPLDVGRRYNRDGEMMARSRPRSARSERELEAVDVVGAAPTLAVGVELRSPRVLALRQPPELDGGERCADARRAGS